MADNANPTTSTTNRFRPPLPPPIPHTTETKQQRTISFRHPGYPDLIGPNLVSLDAVDHELGDGIDYDTALVACGIVACNRWSQSWFGVKDSQGASVFRAVPRPHDGLLRESIYYFFVSQDKDEQYAVIPSFDHWRFPHGDLPDIWQALDIPSPSPPVASRLRHLKVEGKHAAEIRDESCRLTAWTNAAEACHLVPSASATWFAVNVMSRYCRLPGGRNPVDDDRNLILLRRDLHWLFDQRHFTILPKRSPGDLFGSPSLVFHTLQPRGDCELHDLFHNRTLQQPTSGLSVEFLFARFAWSIFCDEIYPFLTGTFRYAVQLFDPTTGAVKTETRNSLGLSSVFQVLPSRTSSRSISPRKRKAADTQADHDSDNGDELDSDGDQDEPPRGRSRERKRRFMGYLRGFGPLVTEPSLAGVSVSTLSTDVESCGSAEDGAEDGGVTEGIPAKGSD
jgi:hypothetical protein